MIDYMIGAAGAAGFFGFVFVVRAVIRFVTEMRDIRWRVQSEFDGNSALYNEKASKTDLKWLIRRVEALENLAVTIDKPDKAT